MSEAIGPGDVGALAEVIGQAPTTPALVLITVYDMRTGAALYSATVAEGAENSCCGRGRRWIAGEAERVDLETGQAAPLLTFAPTIEPDRIGDIPPGTETIVGLTRYPASKIKGEITFALDYATTMRVRLLNPIYRPATFEVACEAHL